MAFSFREPSNNNWLNIIGIVLLLVFLIMGTYYLFFAPEPLVEVIAPPELESISEFSDVNIGSTDFTNLPTYQQLREQVSDPTPGEAGRENPFAPF